MAGPLNGALPCLCNHLEEERTRHWSVPLERAGKLRNQRPSSLEVTRRQTSSIQKFVLWRKNVWQASAYPWHALRSIWCVLCVAWRGSSFLSLAAPFMSLFFLTSSPVQPLKRFWPECMENTLWKWHFSWKWRLSVMMNRAVFKDYMYEEIKIAANLYFLWEWSHTRSACFCADTQWNHGLPAATTLEMLTGC